MNDDSKIRHKALHAMKAVTAGALLFAGVACSGDDDTTNGPNWNIGNQNAGNATTTDTGGDADGDASSQNDDQNTVVADAGEDCNDEESTGVCPEHCDEDNDVDCCEEIDWGYGEWSDEYGCMVAIPGPFVPPCMPEMAA